MSKLSDYCQGEGVALLIFFQSVDFLFNNFVIIDIMY